MKKLITTLSIAVCLMAACQSKNTGSNAGDSASASSKEIDQSKQCYQSIKNRDTANLSLNLDNEKVTGSLSYHLFEKDKNNGILSGIVKGDTIIADYTFQSEGTTSIRQVVWLKKNNQLVEGFGEVKEVDGKTQFKNLGKLDFGKSLVFDKINCK